MDKTLDHSVVSINPLDIQGEFCRVSEDLGWWSVLAAEAESELVRAKQKLDRVEAAQADLVRSMLLSEGTKPTVDVVNSKVRRSQVVQAAENEYAEAVFNRTKLKGIALAIKTKADMLVSLGSMIRAELHTINRT